MKPNLNDISSAFSPDYVTARSRFLEAAKSINCEIYSYPIKTKTDDDLTIDIAICRGTSPKALVVSSGLHGAEGFLGSAVQLSLLKSAIDPRTTLILIHALNPYGFKYLRRTNEDNIDLNRNFLLEGDLYAGSPPLYGKLNQFFNPASPPPRFEPYLLKAIAIIARYSIKAMKETLPVGQYDYPQGLFFGGKEPSQTANILEKNIQNWIGDAQKVIHIDFHTGLGTWGTYKLFAGEVDNPQKVQSLTAQFGVDKIETWTPQGISYPIRGGLGEWCKAKFPEYDYDFLTAEFGTYPTLKVVKALRAENRAFWYSQSVDTNLRDWFKEIFAPSDRTWRDVCVTQGLEIIQIANQALSINS